MSVYATPTPLSMPIIFPPVRPVYLTVPPAYNITLQPSLMYVVLPLMQQMPLNPPFPTAPLIRQMPLSSPFPTAPSIPQARLSSAFHSVTPTPPTEQVERVAKRQKKYLCKVFGCGKSFDLQGSLKRHDNFHKNPNRFSCLDPACGKRFISARDLKRHKVTHTKKGQRTYPCDECGNIFYRPECIVRHMRIHSNVKIKCGIGTCTYSTADLSNVQRHRKRHRTLDNQKKPQGYACERPDCDAVLSAKSSLNRHRWVHIPESEWPLVCKECPKRFYDNSHLRRHENIHSESVSEEDKCKKCNYVSKDRSNWQRHQLCHVRKEGWDFWCEKCERSFSAKTTFEMHVFNHHKSR